MHAQTRRGVQTKSNRHNPQFPPVSAVSDTKLTPFPLPSWVLRPFLCRFAFLFGTHFAIAKAPFPTNPVPVRIPSAAAGVGEQNGKPMSYCIYYPPSTPPASSPSPTISAMMTLTRTLMLTVADGDAAVNSRPRLPGRHLPGVTPNSRKQERPTRLHKKVVSVLIAARLQRAVQRAVQRQQTYHGVTGGGGGLEQQFRSRRIELAHGCVLS
ncbi:hypothetical protein B0T25DRAFT_343587 [Lasiosphaeria hispida]|uniref:Uncharacterized protein n=1 Tax=Lasiosphaeria hispida TaxID=260671 RepID=A0AAJ0M8C6_9PEZI|nr:hypothetical protein B0T25DRAFT_343587 [Lasiosphaeria hispida]